MKLKNTQTRIKVLNLLSKATEPMSASQIFDSLKKEKLNLSTIYRTLNSFTAQNIINCESDRNGTVFYFLPKENHNHILECKTCHKKIVLPYCPYEKVNKKIKQDTDFVIDESNRIIYGLCKDCIKN